MGKYYDGPFAFMYRQLFCQMPPLPSVDLADKRFLITGANTGVGFALARQITSLNGGVIMAVRSLEKGEAARDALLKDFPAADIQVFHCDLESFDSVNGFVARLMQDPNKHKIQAVILNAAIMVQKWQTSSTGYERSIQVNVLSNALLALLLLPILTQASSPTRLIMVTSEVHAFTPFKERSHEPLLDAFGNPDNFDIQDRYFSSKLLNLLWTLQLCRKVDSHKVKVVLASPGGCRSQLLREVESSVITTMDRMLSRTSDEGAKMIAHAAFGAPDSEVHGAYYSQGKLVPTSGFSTSPEGLKMQNVVWDEISKVLEGACPRIMERVGLEQ